MKKRLLRKLTYANVTATLALFLALSGGVAFAASKIRSGQIAHGAVKTVNLHKRAVTSGKIAVGAVHTNQIGSKAVAPSNMQVPLYFPATPSGGSLAVPIGEPVAYPLSGASWVQKPEQINVIFGGAIATLAYDGSGSGSCRAFIEIILNGKTVGGGEISTSSESLQQVEQSIGAGVEIDPISQRTNELTAKLGSNGDCTTESVLNSTRFRVVDFG